MADNVTLDPGAGGAVIATDDDATAHHQYVKVEFGGDGTFTKVTSSVGLPTDPLDRAARDMGKIDIAMGQAAHDAAGAAIDPVAIAGYASAAAPTDVTADTDIVRAWHLRNGAYAVNLTAAGALIPGDATNGLDVDVIRVPAPLNVVGGGTEAAALRVTLASDSTGLISVDDNAGSLTVDGTVTANIGTSGSLNLEATQASVLTAVQLIDDTVQVLGTDTYTEATSKALTLGAVRRDADTSLVNTTNEFAPLQVDALGRLKVEVFSGETLPISGTVTANAGTNLNTSALSLEATQASVLTAVQLIDNPVQVLGTDTYTEATSSGMTIGAVRRDADTTLVSLTNEFGPLQMDANGRLKVECFSGETLPISGTVTANAGSGTFTVSGTVTANIGTSGSLNLEATQASVLTAVQLIDDTIKVLGTDTYTEATTKGSVIGVVRRDADTSAANTDNEVAPLLVDANGYLKVEIFDGGGSHTVDGTVTANAGSGTFTVSGTVTANIGTSGSLNLEATQSSVLTSVQLIDDTIKVLGTDTYTEATTKGTVIGAVRRDADTSPVNTDNEIGPLTMDANGRLKVEIFAGGDTHPVSGTVTANIGTSGSLNLEATQTSVLTAVQKIDDPVLVDDAAFTPATSSVMMAGFQADETGTDSVNEGDAGAGRMTLDRKVIVTQQPHSAGGLSIFRSLDLDETEEDVKTSAGQVYSMWITNTATTTRWIKFYNDTAANVIVGTTTPLITFGIPGNSSDDVAGLLAGANGIAFGTAICVAATTGFADADTGAPGANDIIINIFYA